MGKKGWGDGNGGKRKGTITSNETGGDCTIYPFGTVDFSTQNCGRKRKNNINNNTYSLYLKVFQETQEDEK